MAQGPLTQVLRQLRRSVLLEECQGRSDGELLASFLTCADSPAFAALVQRHGPMVLGVCRRVLQNSHDAEDAFQAVFLVLVRKGAALQDRASIGNWLHGVAFHTALKARAAVVKRRAKESRVADRTMEQDPAERHVRIDLAPLLDRELHSLPDKYREAVVLCNLEGKSRKEVAQRLGIPEGTLSSRLATAHRLLAGRLSRQGISLSAGGVALVLSQQASAAVPADLLVHTVQAAGLAAAGKALAGIVSAKVSALTEGVLQTMRWTHWKLATAFLLAACLAVGIGPLVWSALTQAHGQGQAAAPLPLVGAANAAKAPADAEKAKEDPKDDKDVRVIDSIEGADLITLEGKVKKLRIKSISGASQITCAADFEAEEIEINGVEGAALIRLKLADKAKVKKLVIGTIQGAGQLDCSELDVEAVQIKSIDGAALLKFGKAISIDIGEINGAGSVTVQQCKDFIVQQEIAAAGSVDVGYYGTVKCDAGEAASVQLKKIDPPK
jgi:RNA polymerase sigma factor (sigma-70 family)